MTETMERPAQRRSPAEKARDERVAQIVTEVHAKHGNDVECVFSLWGPEMYVAVWQDGKCIGNYEHVDEDA